MRASFSPRSLFAVLASAATLLSACDRTVTAPAADRAPSDPNALVIGGVTWTRTTLPFIPKAINAAGVIVGIRGTEAVRWRNGVLDTLPHLSSLSGPYIAVDITPNGVVLGGANGHIVYWAQDHMPPVDVGSPQAYVGQLTPIAMNDSYTIVGWGRNSNTAITSLRYKSGGWTDIGAGFGSSGQDQSVVTGLNSSGQASGWRSVYTVSNEIPVRWNATSTSPITLPGGLGKGMGIDVSGNIFGYTQNLGNEMWYANGSTALVNLPAMAWKRSDAGRFVGYAMNAGTMQVFTSFNGTLTWLASPDATSPTPAGVNSCGTIIAGHTATDGFMFKRTSMLVANTCDTPPVLAQ
ncbi:MAG TPA: hypothetical protein VGM82_08485 [Gemmatimonadaceae bacterium]|jgi:hypothetical protein